MRDGDLALILEAASFFGSKGYNATIIGGKAVAVYAELSGVESISKDLDVYVTEAQQQRLFVEAAKVPGVQVVSKPQPRSLRVLVLDWKGLEVDVLISSAGLPPPETVWKTAWKYPKHPHVRIVDPFSLLKNKLQVNRPKDQPHIKILHAYVEGLIKTAFEARWPKRLEYGKKFLDATGSTKMPGDLFDFVAPFADRVVGPFLVQTAPSREAALRACGFMPAPEQVAVLSMIERVHPSKRA
ncbi:MAG: hypothetical protein JKY37_23130 [Nannocystaceae bacterium]|nr:hypothetical protein [Nannocystaceae bacterium]